MSLQLEFSGSPAIATARQMVWRRLVDPDFVAKSAPGVTSVQIVAPGHFQIASTLGIGPVKLPLTIDVELFDLVEPEHAQLRVSISTTGSTVQVLSTVQLAAVDAAH